MYPWNEFVLTSAGTLENYGKIYLNGNFALDGTVTEHPGSHIYHTYKAKTLGELKKLRDGDFDESPDDVAPAVAIGWAAPTTDGKFLCTWMYYATASHGDESYETAEDQEKTPTDTFNFACIPAPDTGKLRRRKLCANATEMATFFGNVKKSS